MNPGATITGGNIEIGTQDDMGSSFISHGSISNANSIFVHVAEVILAQSSNTSTSGVSSQTVGAGKSVTSFHGGGGHGASGGGNSSGIGGSAYDSYINPAMPGSMGAGGIMNENA